jgi:hypothetical protein
MPLWSTLNNDQKNNALRIVIEKAGWNQAFYNECTSTNPSTVRTAVEREARVTFDADVEEVKCFKDKAAAEKRVLILLAPLVPQEQAPQVPLPPDLAYWMCTYPTYVPR